jgi:uncharacterized protein DUF1629
MDLLSNIPPLPAELRALLDDPRLADMKDSPDPMARSTRVLEPRDPPKPGESHYLRLRNDYEASIHPVHWVNEPKGLPFLARTGEGQGFPLVTERPRFEQSRMKHDIGRDVWYYGGWLIASSALVEILQRFDPSVIETIDIDWTFTGGQRHEGLAFLDVRRFVSAYDYPRMRLVVQMHKGVKSISHLAYPQALKPDIDPAVHIFREGFFRSDIFISRALANAVAQVQHRGIRFEDPATGDTVRFASLTQLRPE